MKKINKRKIDYFFFGIFGIDPKMIIKNIIKFKVIIVKSRFNDEVNLKLIVVHY